MPFLAALPAEAEAQSGEICCLVDGQSSHDRNQARWAALVCVRSSHRVRGEIMLRRDRNTRLAEEAFSEALSVGHKQKARFLICARQPAWPGFGATKGSGTGHGTFSLGSTVRSPRALTRWMGRNDGELSRGK
jgi:hypothetical protein